MLCAYASILINIHRLEESLFMDLSVRMWGRGFCGFINERQSSGPRKMASRQIAIHQISLLKSLHRQMPLESCKALTFGIFLYPFRLPARFYDSAPSTAKSTTNQNSDCRIRFKKLILTVTSLILPTSNCIEVALVAIKSKLVPRLLQAHWLTTQFKGSPFP